MSPGKETAAVRASHGTHGAGARTGQDLTTRVGSPPIRPLIRRGQPSLPLPRRLTMVLQRWAAPTLRVSLAAVFIWFGVLKLIGNSPVKAMIAATLPWLDAGIGVPALGAVEVALGIALMTRWLPRLTLIGLAAHLSGTFLTFLVAPDLMMQHGNPLLLTAAGEFVIKNFVLLSAALVLLAQTAGETTAGDRRLTAHPIPTPRDSS